MRLQPCGKSSTPAASFVESCIETIRVDTGRYLNGTRSLDIDDYMAMTVSEFTILIVAWFLFQWAWLARQVTPAEVLRDILAILTEVKDTAIFA